MGSVGRTARRYRGMTAAERRASRRERMLEAGLEQFGTIGYARSSVRSISATAGLNSRYFYESFSGREELLNAVYHAITTEIAQAAVRAIGGELTIEGQSRSGLQAACDVLIADPRKARVIGVEVVGVSERLEALRRQTRHAFADLLVHNALSIARENLRFQLDPVLTARALVGGFMEVLVEWVNGELDTTQRDIVEHFTRLFTVAAYAALADETGRPLIPLDELPTRAAPRAGARGRQTRAGRQGSAAKEASGRKDDERAHSARGQGSDGRGGAPTRQAPAGRGAPLSSGTSPRRPA